MLVNRNISKLFNRQADGAKGATLHFPSLFIP